MIPRQGKKNPSGKLYSKYVNSRSKRKRRESSGLTVGSKCNIIGSLTNEDVEVDQSIATALKTSLFRDSSDWNAICDNWQKTDSLR